MGIGYTHHQRIFKENGKTVSELDKERDCLICKGLGFIVTKNG